MPKTRATHWQLARVTDIREETPDVKTFRFALQDWQPHAPGQHYLLRLTAEDGYQARRSYSVASPPERANEIELTIERLPDGEVSPYLHDVVKVGDQIELRGPQGGYFVWKATYRSPLWLIAGGSGIVPLMAMLRHRELAETRVPARLLYSIKSPEEEIYSEELQQLAASDPDLVIHRTYTQKIPALWDGDQRRVDQTMLQGVYATFSTPPLVYVCGPTAMVEFVAHNLVELGLPGIRIRTERFG
ncbi:MAG: ferredoxin reductase [Bacteroidota bacterium]